MSEKECKGGCKEGCACKDKSDKHTLIPKPVKITHRLQESETNFTITLDAKLKHDAGQFIQVSIPGVGEAPISFASYSDKFVKLNVNVVGKVTAALQKLKVGDKILIRGPYGHGYPLNTLHGNNIYFVGGGCGVAPLKGAIDYVEKNRDSFKKVSLFLGYRSPNDILFKKELEEWKDKYHLTVTVDQNPTKSCYEGAVGFVTDAVQKADISTENSVVLVCGPPPMMNAALKILMEKGFKDEQIFVSHERLMYCGIGVCCHCMIQDKFCCEDGPVFRYDEIKGYEFD